MPDPKEPRVPTPAEIDKVLGSLVGDAEARAAELNRRAIVPGWKVGADGRFTDNGICEDTN